ncbi:MAG TPA: phosphoribosylaminoimidazolesuccinocarboxamide synthase [Candidatus Saccharimonadales bacterium]|nr:phosphoribosylaminoimidazolesuccinocarboxamide synthase [Candidatus Saccharimonadales bacterium]
MEQTLTGTDFEFSGQTGVYHGKVRDVYSIGEKIVVVTTDRISAFDVVSKQGIPYKGQVLNQIASWQLEQTKDIVPNWADGVPDPNVTLGKKAKVFPIEVIVRGYLAGSAWRSYKAGSRNLCGNKLPEGMTENQKFESPLITPTTKAEQGHDQDITPDEIVAQGLITKEEWAQISEYALKLFARGSEIAAKQNLILVDTKYEFGKLPDEQIILLDELHTPDSSRFFYADSYDEKFAVGEPQHQLSKEFIREWLASQGYKGETPDWPVMPDDIIKEVSDRYIELYEKITGNIFVRPVLKEDIAERIKRNISSVLEQQGVN